MLSRCGSDSGLKSFMLTSSLDGCVCSVFCALKRSFLPHSDEMTWVLMQRMHDAGLAHCDLKPANVVIMPDGSTKLADFGAACAINGQTGRLATIHGNAMRDREIELLLTNRSHNITRTTQDSMSAFGSVWGGTDWNNEVNRSSFRRSSKFSPHNSSRDSCRASSSDNVQHQTEACQRIEENADDPWVWTMSQAQIPEQAPPFEPVDGATTSTQLPTLLGRSSTAMETAFKGPPVSLLTQPLAEQPQEAERPVELALRSDICQEYVRHTATQSTLLRPFRSCPGSSHLAAVSDPSDGKADRRGVRWFSGTGSSVAIPLQRLTGHSMDINLLETQRSSFESRQSCSRIRAYSVRDVPMVRSLSLSLISFH
jgi:serine/threonine protein kinase